MEKQLERMQEQLDKIAEALIGDPADERKPGIIIRLDRIEHGFLNMKWLFRVFIVCVVAPLTTAIVLRVI